MKIVLGLLFCFFILLAIKSKRDEKLNKEKVLKNIREDFKVQRERSFTEAELAKIMVFHNRNKNEYALDEITINDLDLRTIYGRLNSCETFYGSEQLYHILFQPVYDEAVLKKLDKCVEYMRENEEVRTKLSYSLRRMKNAGIIPLSECLEDISGIKNTNIRPDLICFSLGILASVGIFAFPVAGFFVFFGVLFFNLLSYFKRKKNIAPYIASFSEILRLIYYCRTIDADSFDENLMEYIFTIKKDTNALGKFARGAFLLTSGRQATGNLIDVVLDYFRMFLHLDIIKFYMMTKIADEKKETILELSGTVGMLDACIAIASYRESLSYYVKPEFSDDSVCEIKDVYHPLIENCVSNSIRAEKGVLITGSNASGKSTFLRQIALSAVLAQTIYTVPARFYCQQMVRVATSMSLRDSVMGGDSYYMAEIKSLLRIMEYSKQDIPLMCFVDEVLRGTNTAERIAASTELLAELSNNSLCFAATHDMELCDLLTERFDNYHFYETVDVDSQDITFSYQLKEGKSTSTNAIRLLLLMGYDNKIVDKAIARCRNFLVNGKWE